LGERSDRRRQVRQHTKRGSYVIALVLLCAALVLVGAGIALFLIPSAPVSQPQAFSIELSGPPGIGFENLSIGVSQNPSGSRSTISILADVQAQQQATNVYQASNVYQAEIQVPSTERATDCNPRNNCVSTGNYYSPIMSVKPLDNVPTASASMTFVGPPLGFATNGTSAAAELPSVLYPTPPTGPQFLISSVLLTYVMPDASSYDWNTGTQPESTTKSLIVWNVEGQLGANPGGSGMLFSLPATPAVGVNHTADTRNSVFTFAAGILIGIAGGAFVGALQEALHARRERKNGPGT
jgi:hypothetical protein